MKFEAAILFIYASLLKQTYQYEKIPYRLCCIIVNAF